MTCLACMDPAYREQKYNRPYGPRSTAHNYASYSVVQTDKKAVHGIA
jgi:hypothetical protein